MGASTRKGSTSGRESAQTQGNQPPSWALPLFSQGAGDALALYRTGRGGNTYSGQRVVDLSNITRGAVDGLNNNAAAFGNAALQEFLGQQTAASRNLGTIASPAAMGAGNAAFQQNLQNTLDNAATTINSRMSGAGRYGSGVHNRLLAQNLGQIAAQQTADQYNRDRQDMLAANAQIDNANQNQLNAASNFLNRQGEAYGRNLSGGRVLDEVEQTKLDAERQQWEETEMKDWDRLGLLAKAANDFAGSYGNKTTQNEIRTRQNPSALEIMGGFGRLAGKGR